MGTRRIRKFPITVTEEEAQRLVDTGINLMNGAEQMGGYDEWEPESLEDVQEIMQIFLDYSGTKIKNTIEEVIKLAEGFVAIQNSITNRAIKVRAYMTPGEIICTNIDDEYRLEIEPHVVWWQPWQYSIHSNHALMSFEDLSVDETLSLVLLILGSNMNFSIHNYKQ